MTLRTSEVHFKRFIENPVQSKQDGEDREEGRHIAARSRPDFVPFVCEDMVMSSLFNVQTERGELRLALSAKGAHTCLSRLTCFFSHNLTKTIKGQTVLKVFSIRGTPVNRRKLISQGAFRESFSLWVCLFSCLAAPGRRWPGWSSVQHLPVLRSGAAGVDVELREIDAVVVQILLLLQAVEF